MPSGRRPIRDRALTAALGTQVGPTRRDFLRLGGLATLGMLLPSCVAARPSTTTSSLPIQTDLRVGVVGAGLAGLSAAYWLSKAGAGVSVFEAQSRVGGRCWSARGLDGGQVGEHGGEFIDTRHVHMKALVDELGLELDDLWSAWTNDTTWLQIVDGEVDEALERYDWMVPAVSNLFELSSLGAMGGPDTPTELAALDEMTAEEWYRHEVGPIDDGRYRLWSRDMSTWFGLDPGELGAGNLIDYYTYDYPGADERYTVMGGNDQVPALIADSLPAGSLHLDAPVDRVSLTSSGAVEIGFATGASPEPFDRVILAVPFTTLRKIDLDGAGLTDHMSSAITELAMGTNAKVLMQFDRPFFTGFGDWSGGLNRADDPLFGTWESGSTDGNADLGLLTVYSGGRVGASYDPTSPHGPAPGAVVDETLRALEEAVDGLTRSFTGWAWLDSWVDDPWALGSYAAFAPGQTTRFWGQLAEPQGPIQLAGEQTSTFSQGYLNGGAESGFRTAAAILNEVGVALPPALAETLSRESQFLPRRSQD